MGVLRSTESFEAEVEEFREMLLPLLIRQQDQNQRRLPKEHHGGRRACTITGGTLKEGQSREGSIGRSEDEPSASEFSTLTADDDDGRRVCVTSPVSFLGLALVNRLLARRYTVRLLLDTQEDMEKVREMEMMFESEVEVVVAADMTDADSLCDAFQGCSGVFHTSSFTDSNGLSGYSKHMAESEARTGERVIQACVRTQSVRKCVFTSSLLACLWRRISSPHYNNDNRLHATVDETCWSDENLCRDRKLWFALGKTMAEKAAWRAARGSGDLRLVTMCPGLVTGPGFRRRSSTASIAYLKGAQDMLREGLLATVDVGKLAEAHVAVYEDMSRTACGRYICFDHIVRRAADVAELECQLGLAPNRTSSVDGLSDRTQSTGARFELSKRKLSRLMASSSRRRCSIVRHTVVRRA